MSFPENTCMCITSHVRQYLGKTIFRSAGFGRGLFLPDHGEKLHWLNCAVSLPIIHTLSHWEQEWKSRTRVLAALHTAGMLQEYCCTWILKKPCAGMIWTAVQWLWLSACRSWSSHFSNKYGKLSTKTVTILIVWVTFLSVLALLCGRGWIPCKAYAGGTPRFCDRTPGLCTPGRCMPGWYTPGFPVMCIYNACT